jgi:hypothetical protein
VLLLRAPRGQSPGADRVKVSKRQSPANARAEMPQRNPQTNGHPQDHTATDASGTCTDIQALSSAAPHSDSNTAGLNAHSDSEHTKHSPSTVHDATRPTSRPGLVLIRPKRRVYASLVIDSGQVRFPNHVPNAAADQGRRRNVRRFHMRYIPPTTQTEAIVRRMMPHRCRLAPLHAIVLSS